MTQSLEMIIHEPSQPAKSCVIWLHGLGASGDDFASIVPELQLAEDNTRFIFPHAPMRRVTMNSNFPCRAWFDIADIHNLQNVDSLGLEKMHERLSHLIEQQIAQGIPAKKIIMAGFSQGGAMALFTGLRFHQTLGGVLALSTFFPNIPDVISHLENDNNVIPIFQAHGLYDNVIPLALGKQTHQMLQRYQFPVQWETYPMGHEVCLQEILDMGHWLQAHTAASL